MSPLSLERYSFYWSEARLVIAAVALFLGGVPPVRFILGTGGTAAFLLTIAWIISGVVSCYLLYRWFKGGQLLFGHKNTMDTAAFYVNILSGLNLGLVGLLGFNIGMSISSNYIVFVIVGIAYLVSAYHLYTRFSAHGNRLF